MIITRTPLRVSFFGGGTDYPAYFLEHGGETLATTINKYVTVSVHQLTDLFEHRLQVHYSRVEAVRTVDEIQISVVRETLRHVGVEGGVEIHLVGDLPARSGLGNSSATTVGLLMALQGFGGRMMSADELAAGAVFVEQELIHESVGCQDQYACAHGGFIHLGFPPEGSPHVEPVILPPERLGQLEASLLLYYTGLQRSAHVVLGEQMEKTARGLIDRQLAEMKGQVRSGLGILAGDGPLSEFGLLLHHAWESKRSLSSRISSPLLDDFYERARRAGALGGKLLGAGAGGFLLLFVDPERQDSVREALAPLREVPFRFESKGSSVIYYSSESQRPRAAKRGVFAGSV